MFLASIFAIGFVCGGAVQAQSLDGQWSVAGGMMHGKTVPAGPLASMSLSISGAKFEAKSGGMVSSGALGANTLASPAQLEFSIDTGADQGRKVKAIYEVQNQELKIAFSETDEYPTSFESSEQNKYLVLSYKSAGASTLAASTSPGAATTPTATAPSRRGKRSLSPLPGK
jgi:uncharacterized protein (TIGR03067 family)